MILEIPVGIKYPFYDDNEIGASGQRFPYKTFAMVVSFACLLLISGITRYLFVNRGLKKYDFLGAYAVRRWMGS